MSDASLNAINFNQTQAHWDQAQKAITKDVVIRTGVTALAIIAHVVAIGYCSHHFMSVNAIIYPTVVLSGIFISTFVVSTLGIYSVYSVHQYREVFPFLYRLKNVKSYEDLIELKKTMNFDLLVKYGFLSKESSQQINHNLQCYDCHKKIIEFHNMKFRNSLPNQSKDVSDEPFLEKYKKSLKTIEDMKEGFDTFYQGVQKQIAIYPSKESVKNAYENTYFFRSAAPMPDHLNYLNSY